MEPNKFGNGENQIYIKVDETQYLFEDNKINLSNNTRAEFNVRKAVFEENSFDLGIEFKFKLYLDKENRNRYYYSKGGISFNTFKVVPINTYTTPQLFNIGANFYNGKESHKQFYVTNNRPTNQTLVNDTLFKLLYYNLKDKEVAFEYNGTFLNTQDTNKIKSRHSIKIILKYKYDKK